MNAPVLQTQQDNLARARRYRDMLYLGRQDLPEDQRLQALERFCAKLGVDAVEVLWS